MLKFTHILFIHRRIYVLKLYFYLLINTLFIRLLINYVIWH